MTSLSKAIFHRGLWQKSDYGFFLERARVGFRSGFGAADTTLPAWRSVGTYHFVRRPLRSFTRSGFFEARLTSSSGSPFRS